MAVDNKINPVLRVCATTSQRVRELPIENGQLIFVQDLHRIAFDFNNKRVFYNQIVELDTEKDRVDLSDPVSGNYYFVIETAVLWVYQKDWVQLTSKPEDVIFIGTELPELGQEKTLYVNKAMKEISVWDETSESYEAVSNYTVSMTNEEILNLFN